MKQNLIYLKDPQSIIHATLRGLTLVELIPNT